MKIETFIVAMQTQAKEAGTTAAGGGEQLISPRASGGALFHQHLDAGTVVLTLDFWPLER